MVLKNILFKINKDDGANLRTESADCEYQLYVFRKEGGALYGSLSCFKNDGSGGGYYYYALDSGIGVEKRLMDFLNKKAGEDLSKLDWKPRRPIT